MILLGEIAVDLRGAIRVGEACRLLAWQTAEDGRKHHTAATLHAEDGTCVAVSSATWFEVAPTG